MALSQSAIRAPSSSGTSAARTPSSGLVGISITAGIPANDRVEGDPAALLPRRPACAPMQSTADGRRQLIDFLVARTASAARRPYTYASGDRTPR
jgi:hypothetical protein